MTETNPSKKSIGRRTALATAALVILAALLLLIGILLKTPLSPKLSGDRFSLGGGESPAFAEAGSGLAAATTTGIRLYSERGRCVAESEVSLLTPACTACSYYGAYYDVGVPGFWLLRPNGGVEYRSTSDAVTFAHANADGILTVLTESSAAYKGHVYVYDRDGQALFRWDSGSGYPISGRVSADGLLCVNCVTARGSVLHFFRTDEPDELFSFAAADELIADFGFLSDGTIAAVTESRLVFLNDAGEERFSYSFSGQHLTAYSLDGPYAVTATSSALTGENASLLVLTSHGRPLGTLDTKETVLSLSAAEDRLLVLYENEATLYTSELEEIVSFQNTSAKTRLFLRPDGTALFAGTDGVQTVDFGQ